MVTLRHNYVSITLRYECEACYNYDVEVTSLRCLCCVTFISCECIAGYSGDGIDCYDVNECAGDNDCEVNPDKGYCNNTVGSYECGCYTGYSLTSTQSCQDINECSSPSRC